VTAKERKELIERLREQNQAAIKQVERVSETLSEANEHALMVIDRIREIRRRAAR